jgi:hypothetical protein
MATSTLGEAALKREDAFAIRIAIARQRQAHRQHVRRVEAGIDVGHASETLEQQRGGHRRHQRDRHLRADQLPPDPERVAAAADASVAAEPGCRIA